MSSVEKYQEDLSKCKNVREIIDVASKYAQKPSDSDFMPITVDVPGIPEAKLTYWATKGYIGVGQGEDKEDVPLDAVTSQSLAQTWNMHLPTGKMIDQLTQKGIATGGLIKITPLSASGFGNISARQVVESYIGSPESILEHERRVRDARKKIKDTQDTMMIGEHKIFIAPEIDPSRTYFKGWTKDIDKDPETGKIRGASFYQEGIGPSPHFAEGHVEYGLRTKLIKDSMVLEIDGKQIPVTYQQVVSNPKLSPAITNAPVTTYQTKAILAESDKAKEDASKPSATQPATGILEQAERTVHHIGDVAKTKYEEAKSWIKNIFNEANQFELLSQAELRRFKIRARKNKR